MPVTATASAAVTRTRLIRRLGPVTEPVRTMAPDAWRAAGTPLLRHPRSLVKRLHGLHRPEAGTGIVAVLDAEDRPVASASFALDTEHGAPDGWECRNTILAHLRMIVPDDLRRPAPVRTTVLLLCRDGDRGWEPADGPWLWGLRDACGLHGLRCGAVVVLAGNGWQVVGDGRGGRTPVPLRPSAPTPLPVAAAVPAVPTDEPAAAVQSSSGLSDRLPGELPGGLADVVSDGVPQQRAEIPAQRSRPEISAAPAAASGAASGAVSGAANHPRDKDRSDEPTDGGTVVRLVPDLAAELHYSSA